MTDPMTLREQVAALIDKKVSAAGAIYDWDKYEIADAALSLITEACAKVAEDMERERHDKVGHPLIAEFTPHIAQRIRQMGKP